MGKNAVCVMCLKVADVLDMQELSMVRQKLWMVLVRDFEPVMIILDLSKLTCRDLAYIYRIGLLAWSWFLR